MARRRELWGSNGAGDRPQSPRCSPPTNPRSLIGPDHRLGVAVAAPVLQRHRPPQGSVSRRVCGRKLGRCRPNPAGYLDPIRKGVSCAVSSGSEADDAGASLPLRPSVKSHCCSAANSGHSSQSRAVEHPAGFTTLLPLMRRSPSANRKYQVGHRISYRGVKPSKVAAAFRRCEAAA